MKIRAIAGMLACLFLTLFLIGTGPRAATRKLTALTGAAVANAPAATSAPAASAGSPSVAAGTGLPAARVTNVTIGPGDGGSTVIRVDTTRSVHFTRFTLKHPARVVVDLADTETPRFQHVYPQSAGVLEDVRVAQFKTAPAMVTRVVADLAASEPSRIEPAAGGVRIVLTGHAIEKPLVVPPAAPASTALAPAELRPVRLKRTVAAPRPSIDLSRPVKVDWTTPAARAQAPAVAVKSSPESAPAPHPVQVAAVEPHGLPELLPAARQAIHAAEVLSGSNPVLPVERTIVATPGERQAAPLYTGKPISLDLKDVDILDFFRLIHQISGLNIIVDSDVKGRVTLVLNDVPWDQALDLVLRNNDLGKVLQGNVLRIALTKTLTSQAENQSQLYDARIESEPLVTVFRRLKYAHAADQRPMQTTSSIGGGGGGMQGNNQPIPGVATILKSFQKGTVLTARGNVVADPRDNAVIITDVASQIPVIESVVDQLDSKAKQVSIQVRVILANSNFTRQLSALLSTVFQSSHAHTTGAGATGQGITAVAPPSPPLPSLAAVTQPTSVAASGFGAYSITTQAARYAINAAITAAESHDQARTISRPSIVTQDNVRGEVQQGVQVPIQTDINNTIAIQYVNATLDLSVTPQVTVDNKIFLKIYVNNASIGAIGVFAGPTINTQEATTQVLVPDGGTVVFGGITVTTRGRSATYVPLLGSIPVIGNLFKSSAINDQNQELLFFVSPTILPG